MGTLRVTLTEDEAVALLNATGRVKRLPRNHVRLLLAAERKLLDALPDDVKHAYRTSLSLAGEDQDNAPPKRPPAR